MNIYFYGMCISLVCYVVIGLFISRKVKNANDFYVAGRRAPVLLIVGSMIASYVSTGMFMGDAGEMYSGFFFPIVILSTLQVAGYIYGAVFFGRYLRRSQVYTIPEFFGKRFCSEKMRLLATITSIVIMVVYLLSVVQGVGTLMHTVTGVDYNLCITLATVAFLLVCVTSGSSGVLITDTIMFGVFTAALVAAVAIIITKAGGWNEVVQNLVNFEKTEGLLFWGGNPDYLYEAPTHNLIWAVIYGISWMSVCAVGPWQSSRYLMAKNEHTVVRSSLFSALGIFLLQLFVGLAAVTVNLFDPQILSPSQVLIWASMNILPTVVGVVLLTGVLAAGISSATTFLSLIGSAFANDVFKGSGNKIRIGRIAMIIVSVIVLTLGIFNPPQIFWIMYLGGSAVAASWMPVAAASILSKRVTKTGAFCGMITGFTVFFVLKLYSGIAGVTLPVYLEPAIVGMVINAIALIIGSALTKVTEEEKAERAKLFIAPQSEKNPKDIKITKIYLAGTVLLGIVITTVLLAVWAIPYLNALS